MNKIFLICIVCIVCMCLLCGCGTNDKNKTISSWERCGNIEKPGEDICVYYDKYTKVMYVCDGFCASILLNADGTPMLWEDGD